MPRHRGDLTVNWKLCLSMPVAAAIEQLTMDTTTGKPRYGSRRQLIENLLARYLKEIGWADAAAPIVERRPLSDADIARITSESVEKIYA